MAKTLIFYFLAGILFFGSMLCHHANAGNCGNASCSGSSPWTSASASYADVNHCVNVCAKNKDTVIVPAGTATWNNALRITQGIILKGTGRGKTVLQSSITDVNAGIITIIPAFNETFRITGFTLDGNNMSNCIYVENSSLIKINQIRIDHNDITHPKGYGIVLRGTVYGVIDNNNIETFTTGNWGIDISGIYQSFSQGGAGHLEWKNFDQTAGNADNIYVEDNHFYGAGFYFKCGGGGRYVSRYNSFHNNARGSVYALDAHGNQGSDTYQNYSTMLVEVYGNAFDFKDPDGTNRGGRILDHRGGRGIVFENLIKNATSSTITTVREEYDDNHMGTGFVQHVSDSYYWGNYRDSILIIPYIIQDDFDYSVPVHNSSPTLAENRDFWTQRASFTGIVNMGCQSMSNDVLTNSCGTIGGIGCGTLSQRPSTCTPGVAYWVTDQSCTDLTGRVGANPSTPISGILFKCTATNSWEAYYTPYTYPHPLRIDDDTTPPAEPAGLTVR